MNKVSEKIIISRIVPPFNFDLTAKVFSDEVGLCMRDEQICKYSDRKYWTVLRVNEKLILAVVKSIGDVNKPKLEVDLISNERLSEDDKEKSEAIISRIFNLDFDLKPFYRDAKNDGVLLKLIEKLYGLKVPQTSNIFEAFVYVILEQQISLQAAYNIERRFIKKYGDVLKINGKEYYAFPTPERVASIRVDDMCMCGMSRRKAEYICNIAKLISKNKLKVEELKHKKDEEVLQELCKIRGVGRWTAELVMIRGMGRLLVIPAADLGLRDHIAYYYLKNKKRASIDEVRQIAEKWGKWRGIAGFYITIAGRLRIEV
jgi:DNA-3-methyladenine glycosylase II